MKLKIKVKVITPGCMPVINEKGDWVDLKSAIDITIPAPQSDVSKRKTVGTEEISYRNVEIPVYYIPLFPNVNLFLRNLESFFSPLA